MTSFRTFCWYLNTDQSLVICIRNCKLSIKIGLHLNIKIRNKIKYLIRIILYNTIQYYIIQRILSNLINRDI